MYLLPKMLRQKPGTLYNSKKMAYDQNLEQRLDYAFDVFPKGFTKDITKKKMFGGLTYLFKGKMTIGIFKKDLMVRVIDSKMEEMLKQYKKKVKHMKKGFFGSKYETLMIDGKQYRRINEGVMKQHQINKLEEALQNWIELGIEHAQIRLQGAK